MKIFKTVQHSDKCVLAQLFLIYPDSRFVLVLCVLSKTSFYIQTKPNNRNPITTQRKVKKQQKRDFFFLPTHSFFDDWSTIHHRRNRQILRLLFPLLQPLILFLLLFPNLNSINCRFNSTIRSFLISQNKTNQN